MMQVHHIERSWAGHYAYRWLGIPPTAKCGAIIWTATEDTEPWEYCPACVGEHAGQGYAVPPDYDGDFRVYSPGETDPARLMHISTTTGRRVHDWTGIEPTALCDWPIGDVHPDGQIGRCGSCEIINGSWPEWHPEPSHP